MPEWSWQWVWLWLPLAIVVLPCVVAALAGSFIVFALAHPKFEMLDDGQENWDAFEMASYFVDDDWLEQNGFVWEGVLVMKTAISNTRIVTWRQASQNTFIAGYLFDTGVGAGIRNADIVTVLAPTVGVTTGEAAESDLFPAMPGEYSQSFPGTTLDERWQRHLEAVELVRTIERLGEYRLGTIADEFERAVVGQIRGVRQRPFWPLRIPWWYFVRRRRVARKTVAELIELGYQRPLHRDRIHGRRAQDPRAIARNASK